MNAKPYVVFDSNSGEMQLIVETGIGMNLVIPLSPERLNQLEGSISSARQDFAEVLES